MREQLDDTERMAQAFLADPNIPQWQKDAMASRLSFLAKARPAQIPPPGDWHYFLNLSGRGAGKSWSMSHECAHQALSVPHRRIAVVAATVADIRDTCFEGPSGLVSKNPDLAAIPPSCVRSYNRSLFEIELVNGTIIKGFGAEAPERLRGPNNDLGFADELCSWPMDAIPEDEENYGGSGSMAWDMLMFTLRIGDNPRVCIATTPKPVRILKYLMNDPNTVMVSESTHANKDNLSKKFFHALTAYEGTALGRQEIYAEVLDNSAATILKRGWWMVYSKNALPIFSKIIISLDTAFKANKKSDYTACTVWGLYKDDYEVETDHPYMEGKKVISYKQRWGVMLLRNWKQKLKFPDLRDAVKEERKIWIEALLSGEELVKSQKTGKLLRSQVDFDQLDPEEIAEAERGLVILIEDKGSGMSVLQELHAAGIRAIPYNPGKDSKVTRAESVSDILRRGHVHIPGERVDGRRSSKDWGDEPDAVVAECDRFTGADTGYKDDYVDTCSQAWGWIRNSGYVNLDSDERYRLKPAARDEDDEDDGPTARREAIYG